MKNNTALIQEIIDYIETHLEENLTLDSLARQTNYSKYHISRMFAGITGFPIHNYIRRRRLTEAARLLVFTDRSIMDIALSAGYETQRSFTAGFKSLFRCSPQAFRKKQSFYPIQLKFTVNETKTLKGDIIMDIKTVTSGSILLTGYRKNTRFGFFVIGTCWRHMHAKKLLLTNRTDSNFLIGLNDYSNWDADSGKQPAFDYFAAAQVDSFDSIPKGMETKELPPGRYLVFSYQGRREDSMQPAADYIYKEWFPQSTFRLNEHALYDFVKYGESTDENGMSLIEYWVPIL